MWAGGDREGPGGVVAVELARSKETPRSEVGARGEIVRRVRRTAEESRTPSISGCSRSEPSYLAVEVEEEVLVVVVHEEMQMAEDMIVEGWQQRTST